MTGSARARHTDAIVALVRWERETGVASHRHEGVSLWRLVRTGIVRRHLVAEGVRGLPSYNRPSIGRVLDLARGVVASAFHWLRLRPRRVLFVGFARRRLDGGVWVDTFCDPLIDLVGADEAARPPSNSLAIALPEC